MQFGFRIRPFIAEIWVSRCAYNASNPDGINIAVRFCNLFGAVERQRKFGTAFSENRRCQAGKRVEKPLFVSEIVTKVP